jgi:hypothetical protein
MKLSAEEKERRREATKARDRAHHARYRELRDAEKAGEAEIEQKYAPEIEPAAAAEHRMEAERDSAIAELDRQIAALKTKRESTWRGYSDGLSTAHAVASEIYGRRNAAKRALDVEMNRRFPDLCGSARWSAAAWKSIEEFLPRIEQAAEEKIARKGKV